MLYPETAVGISFLETGGWREGDRMTRYNNWFAFKKNSRNLHSALGNSSYCIYATVDASLADYRAYEQMVIEKYGIRSETEYRFHITKNYAADRRYGRKLLKSIQHTKNL